MRLQGAGLVNLLLLLIGYSIFLTTAAPAIGEDPTDQQIQKLDQRSILTSRSPPFHRSFPPGFSHNVANGWIIDFHTFYTLLPMATAASKLQSFYEDIAYLAATTKSSTSTRFFYRMGTIDLEIRSQMGEIPRAMVIAFANSMRELTKRGFTNTYQVNYINKATGQLLTVSLWVGVVRWG